MMKSTTSKILVALTALTVSYTLPCSAQTVIYRETFGNNTGASINANDANIGWNALYTTTVGGNLIDGSAGGGVVAVSSGLGSPNNLDNVNAGTSLSATNGYVFNSFVVAGLDYTSEFTIDRTAFTLNTVSWNANRNTGASGVPTQNFAVQIGGNWYVTTPPVTSNVGGTSNAFDVTNNLISINLQTTTWNSLSASVGAPISVGSTTSLPSGNITSFGIFYDNGANAITTRFDTVAITATAVPEPSTYGAILGVAVIGMAMIRRRKRA